MEHAHSAAEKMHILHSSKVRGSNGDDAGSSGSRKCNDGAKLARLAQGA